MDATLLILTFIGAVLMLPLFYVMDILITKLFNYIEKYFNDEE